MIRFGGGDERVCGCGCGETFISQNSRQKYRSTKCKNRDSNKARNRPHEATPTRGCAYCGGDLPRGRKRFCTDNCALAHRAIGKRVAVPEAPAVLPAVTVRLGMFGI